jgi:hypothetical protein
MREYLVTLSMIRVSDGVVMRRQWVSSRNPCSWDFVTEWPVYESSFGPFYYVASVRV